MTVTRSVRDRVTLLEEFRWRRRIRPSWNALYVRELVRIAENTMELAREQLARAQLNRNQGAGSEYDLLQSQVDAANQEPLLVSARSAGQVAMLDLKRVLNLPQEGR